MPPEAFDLDEGPLIEEHLEPFLDGELASRPLLCGGLSARTGPGLVPDSAQRVDPCPHRVPAGRLPVGAVRLRCCRKSVLWQPGAPDQGPLAHSGPVVDGGHYLVAPDIPAVTPPDMFPGPGQTQSEVPSNDAGRRPLHDARRRPPAPRGAIRAEDTPSARAICFGEKPRHAGHRGVGTGGTGGDTPMRAG